MVTYDNMEFHRENMLRTNSCDPTHLQIRSMTFRFHEATPLSGAELKSNFPSKNTASLKFLRFWYNSQPETRRDEWN